MGRCGSTHKSPTFRVLLVAVPARCALRLRGPSDHQRLGRCADAPSDAAELPALYYLPALASDSTS